MKLRRRILMLTMVMALLLSDGSVLAAANTLKLPASVQIIEEEAFYGVQSVDKVELGDNVEEIRARAFADSSLSEINLPDSLTFIDDTAFDGTENVKVTANMGTYAYDWAWEKEYLSSELEDTDVSSFTYSVSNNEVMITKYVGQDKRVKIPDTINGISVTAISSYAFSSNANLVEIQFPESIKTVGQYAFSNCTGLTRIELPDGLTSLGNNAFNGCTNLKRVKTPIVWSTYVNNADATRPFRGCTLEEFIIPEGASEIAYYTFYGNLFAEYKSLNKINIPSTITKIDKYAFAGCNLITSLTVGEKEGRLRLPEGLTSIGEGGFSGCSGLTSVEFPSSLKTIGQYAFSGCVRLTAIELPDGLTSLGNNAFQGCTNLKEVKTPIAWSTTVSNGNATRPFERCTLKEFTIPEGATEITYGTFYGSIFSE